MWKNPLFYLIHFRFVFCLAHWHSLTCSTWFVFSSSISLGIKFGNSFIFHSCFYDGEQTLLSKGSSLIGAELTGFHCAFVIKYEGPNWTKNHIYVIKSYAALCITMLHCVAQCCIMLHNAAQCCIMLHNVALCCTMLHNVA